MKQESIYFFHKYGRKNKKEGIMIKKHPLFQGSALIFCFLFILLLSGCPELDPFPTPEPTEEPTPEPTEVPTAVPTEVPTAIPTPEPTPKYYNEPSNCTQAIGCYRIGPGQVQGFVASKNETVEETFNFLDVMYPVNSPDTGSIQVDLSKYLKTGDNLLTTWVSYGTGAGSCVTVRIVLEVENY